MDHRSTYSGLLLLSPQHLPQAETLSLSSPFCPETQLRCRGVSETEEMNPCHLGLGKVIPGASTAPCLLPADVGEPSRKAEGHQCQSSGKGGTPRHWGTTTLFCQTSEIILPGLEGWESFQGFLFLARTTPIKESGFGRQSSHCVACHQGGCLENVC